MAWLAVFVVSRALAYVTFSAAALGRLLGNRTRGIDMGYRRRTDDPVDPIIDIVHYEVPDLTEWEHRKALEGLSKLPQTAGMKQLVEKLEHSEQRPGHPRPLASLPWDRAVKRGCSDWDLFWDLAGQG